MNEQHFENVRHAIAREMVAAGLTEAVAPAPAALAAGRILAGEQPAAVIRELTERYMTMHPVDRENRPRVLYTGFTPLRGHR